VYWGSPYTQVSLPQSCPLLPYGDSQFVDSIGEILESTFGVDVKPIEDLYGVIVGVL